MHLMLQQRPISICSQIGQHLPDKQRGMGHYLTSLSLAVGEGDTSFAISRLHIFKMLTLGKAAYINQTSFHVTLLAAGWLLI